MTPLSWWIIIHFWRWLGRDHHLLPPLRRIVPRRSSRPPTIKPSNMHWRIQGTSGISGALPKDCQLEWTRDQWGAVRSLVLSTIPSLCGLLPVVFVLSISSSLQIWWKSGTHARLATLSSVEGFSGPSVALHLALWWGSAGSGLGVPSTWWFHLGHSVCLLG